MQLITSTQEDLSLRTYNMMVRFELSLFRFRYRNPWYMIEEGLKSESGYMKTIVYGFVAQTGIN